MNEKKTILVSACLLGEPCRFDGKSKPNQEVVALESVCRLIPVCPECLGGLETPRSPSERRGGRVINRLGEDVTSNFVRGAERALALAQENGCCLAILKERSPSCGCGKIYDGSFTGTLIDGNGVTAELLLRHGIRVLGESQLTAAKDETFLYPEQNEKQKFG